MFVIFTYVEEMQSLLKFFTESGHSNEELEKATNKHILTTLLLLKKQNVHRQEW